MEKKSNVWDKIFVDKGHVFQEVHPDFPRFTAMLDEKKTARVLDLGCGTGRHLVALNKLGFEGIGLDQSPQGLALAQEWLAEEGCAAEIYMQSMFDPFPFPDAYFDALLSIQVIHHGLLHQVQFAAREAQRVLKPGGILWITVPRRRKEDEQGKRKSVEIEPNTYLPQEGFEKGLPHHIFSKEAFADLFFDCEILDLHDDREKHMAIWARRK